MLRDIEVSKGLVSTFLSTDAARGAGCGNVGMLDFSVSVVATGLWPTQPASPEVIYPATPTQLQDLFGTFYSDRFTGRSLHWSPLLGQCSLRANYPGGARKELVVSVFQALVCLLFNGSASLTCKEIGEATRIPQADLHRTLQSLALHKHIKILVKGSKSREVANDDTFSINNEFSHKLYRVVVPQIPAKALQEEEAGVERRVFEDRQHEVD